MLQISKSKLNIFFYQLFKISLDFSLIFIPSAVNTEFGVCGPESHGQSQASHTEPFVQAWTEEVTSGSVQGGKRTGPKWN